MQTSGFFKQRESMVHQQIEKRGVHAGLVLNAMRDVPREIFVPEALQESAYDDAPLPGSGDGHPFSRPYLVALLIAALELKGGEQVLEIGTGSGYGAAVLSRIAKNVYTVERVAQVAEKAAETLASHGFHNVHVLHADGTKGWPDHAPYDAILVAAGSPAMPKSLEQQLHIGGRLIVPVGHGIQVQELVRLTRRSDADFEREVVSRF